MRQFLWGLTPAAIALAMLTSGASAQSSYPEKPIELVCSTSPGSTAAQWCQLMAQVLSKKDVLGAPVHVSYKGGGSGNEAAVYVKQQDADGYTLLHSNASWSGYMNLPTFEPDPSDFEFLARVEKFVYALGAPTKGEFETFADVVEKARQSPGTLPVAGNKIGSIHHKHILSLFNAAGVEVSYVPYEGSGDAVKDVLGQHVPLGLGSIGQWLPHVQSGAIRPLVVLNEERVAAYPDVPTAAELGYPYEYQHQWQGIFVKAGTPPEIKEKLRAAFAKVVDSPEYMEYLKVSPHVEKNFDIDEERLESSFKKELEEFRAFMKENGMI